MIAKKDSEIENLRASGGILSEVLRELRPLVKPGTTTAALDLAAEKGIRARGGVPAFLNYRPQGASYPYPTALCVSVNDEVVHGIPSEKKILQGGDLVSLDLGVSYNGYFSDSAYTMCVPSAPLGASGCDAAGQRLIDATREALTEALKVVRAGAHVGDIGAAVEAVAKKYGYRVVDELGGHAVGKTVHERPFIPNVGRAGEGEKIPAGMVLAIEPIFAEGKPRILLADDQWTYVTADHSRAAHFEQTILVTESGCDILTPL